MSYCQQCADLRSEMERLVADVRSALGAGEHEGPRLAAMRVKAERDDARAMLTQMRARIPGLAIAAGIQENPKKQADDRPA